MYVTTFYSFRGGVGRTMSLVNVAAHLAQLGKRVLIVDFDLEAPGVRTFRSLENPAGESKGLLEYVKTYLETSVVPDVLDYVYQPSLSFTGRGELWIMPSGREDALYSARLGSVDWSHLYSKREGYLFFEELKAQWEKYLKPDYVLIDSRTGHTEVGGICTRQLADAVVTLFIPTEQNLGGLQKVISDIKGESPKKEIKLHYVMSNVPDLDDEFDIVERRLAAFREGLGFSDLSATIHHYHSLQLLEQPIFTIDRPKSKLAREYVTLANAIVRGNLHDREGALSRLRDPNVGISTSELELIKSEHSRDGDILYELAKAHIRSGRIEETLALLNAAEEYGCHSGELYLVRAQLNHRRAENSVVAADLLKALQSPMRSDALNRAVQLLIDVDLEALTHLGESAAFKSLKISERLPIVTDLALGTRTVRIGGQLFRQLLAEAKGDHHFITELVKSFPLVLMADGLFQEACEILRGKIRDAGVSDITDTFNLAMASWAVTRELSKELFQKALNDALSLSPSVRSSPNFSQCLAMSYGALGDLKRAAEHLSLARKQIETYPAPEFSCWRYLKVAPSEFSSDLDAMERMFNGENILPAFMTKTKL